MKTIFIALILIPTVILSQGNQIPFNSKGNSIALTVENTSAITAKNVIVELEYLPEWLKLESREVVLKDIPSRGSKDAEFRFSVGRSAPVGKEEKLKVVIRTSDGQQWTKEIVVTVAPPKEFHLYDNFPNPFNPSTKIAFDLPTTTKVKVVIYDAVGRVIRTVTDEEYDAGFTQLS